MAFDYADESDYGAPGRPAGYPIPVGGEDADEVDRGGLPGELRRRRRQAHAHRRPGQPAPLRDLEHRGACPRARRPARGGPARGRSSSSTRTSAGPTTWTSADAAGLAILPGLVRYDEAFGASPIRHAFRVTTEDTNGYVYPASHEAGNTRRRPADGDPSPSEGVEGHLRVPGVRPADLPGDEDLRPHRGRQRDRHVRPGGLRHPLGQRGPQPGVRRPRRERLRGDPARLEAGRRPRRPRRRGSTR